MSKGTAPEEKSESSVLQNFFEVQGEHKGNTEVSLFSSRALLLDKILSSNYLSNLFVLVIQLKRPYHTLPNWVCRIFLLLKNEFLFE